MNLKEQFDAIDENGINDFICNKQEENLHLEFKAVNRSDMSNRDDRKNLAKSVSGFGNSSGGIIVWGIEANDKNPDGLDCASEKRPIENVPQFIAKLNEHTGQATSPMVEGILHKGIPVASNTGFAVTYVPESYSGPHMAKLGEDRYYKRSGDSFYKMEHFDLEDMFGRRQRPELMMKASLNRAWKQSLENSIKLYILITLVNDGRGSARAPFLEVFLPDSTQEDHYGVDGNGNRGLKPIYHQQNNRSLRFGANSEFVLHPGVSLDVTKLEKTYRIPDPEIEDIQIIYKIVAEGIALREETFGFTADEVRNFLQPTIEK